MEGWEFESHPIQTKWLIKIDTHHYQAWHSALTEQGKDWLAQHQDNVNEWVITGHEFGLPVGQHY